MIRTVTARTPYQPQRPVAPASRPQATAAKVATTAQPTGGSMVNALNDDWVRTGGKLAGWYNAGKTALQGGREVNNAIGTIYKSVKNLKGNGIFNGLKGVVGGALPYMSRSALFAGVISVVTNGLELAKGRIRFNEFGARVVGDSMGGLAGGAGAAVAGGIAMAVLPFAGTMGMIVTGLAGIVGYGLAASAFQQTSLYKKVVGSIRSGLR